jgi:hypothetical protein
MEGMLQPLSVTAFDAVASLASLIVYLGVAFTMFARRPGDVRTRTFLVVALTSAVPYTLSLLQWRKGAGVYTPAAIALTAAAFAIGSAALFHFTQVFPTRRPWIRAHGRWLIAAYVLPVLPVALVAWVVGGLMIAMDVQSTGSGGLGAVSAGLPEALVILGAVPVIFFIGIVLPLAGVTSLFKSWQEAKLAQNEPARVTTFRMLVSQLGGGVLAILVLPLLHLVGVPPVLSTSFAALAYVFALVMPIAYYRGALNLDAPPSTPQLPNSTTPK